MVFAGHKNHENQDQVAILLRVQIHNVQTHGSRLPKCTGHATLPGDKNGSCFVIAMAVEWETPLQMQTSLERICISSAQLFLMECEYKLRISSLFFWEICH